jgi:hypothetical protein
MARIPTFPDVPATYSPRAVSDTSSLYKSDASSYKTEWAQADRDYASAWYYYSGAALEQRALSDTGEPGPLLYPLQINLVKQACNMHALYMWGQYQRGKIVTWNVIPERKSAKSSGRELEAPVKRAEEIQELLEDVFAQEGMVSMLREQGRMFQWQGGVWFKIRSAPEEKMGIAVEPVNAKYVKPVWNPGKYHDLLRVWVEYDIDVNVAKELYGYKGGAEGTVLYREYWSKKEYRITVGDQVARDADGNAMEGANTYIHPKTKQTYLPFVYIPRERTGRFYGDSLALGLQGLQDEINARVADMGDAVTQATHPQVVGWNLTRRKTRGPMQLTMNEIFDAGDTPPGGSDPHIEVLKPPDVSTGVMGFTEFLIAQEHQIAGLSPVMFGEDEGSQRSALTLSMRALPTTSLIDGYRASWADGLRIIANLIMIISAANGINDVEESWLDHTIEVQFASVLPKDREALVNEVVTLYGAGLISLKRAVSLLPDVPDIEAELLAIEEEQKAKLKQEIDQQTKLTEVNAKVQADTERANMDVKKEGLNLTQKEHDMQMRHNQESHDQQIKHKEESHAQNERIAKDREAHAAKRQSVSTRKPKPRTNNG